MSTTKCKIKVLNKDTIDQQNSIASIENHDSVSLIREQNNEENIGNQDNVAITLTREQQCNVRNTDNLDAISITKNQQYNVENTGNQDIISGITKHNNNEEEEDGLFSILFDMIMTFVSLILYVFDIYSDASLGFQHVLNGRYLIALVIFMVVYIASIFTTIFERKKSKDDRGCFFAFMVFTLNLSGILIYKNILYMQYRKIKRKSVDNEMFQRKKQDIAYLKVLEGLFEAFPQLYIQIHLTENKDIYNIEISNLQLISMGTSFLGLTATIASFVNSVSLDPPKLYILLICTKNIWLYCMAALWVISIGSCLQFSLTLYDLIIIILLLLSHSFLSIIVYLFSFLCNKEKLKFRTVYTLIFFWCLPYIPNKRTGIIMIILIQVINFIEILAIDTFFSKVEYIIQISLTLYIVAEINFIMYTLGYKVFIKRYNTKYTNLCSQYIILTEFTIILVIVLLIIIIYLLIRAISLFIEDLFSNISLSSIQL